MSHFCVIVRIPGTVAAGEDLDAAIVAALAPYQENNMGDCPKQFLEFHDEEGEYREGYESGATDMVRCPDGSLVHPWDERFRVPGTIGSGSGTHRVPDGYELVDVPHKERFATFEAFVSDWHGRSERDPEKVRFGYWENPNKKWDWYSVGGRWSGYFPVRPGADYENEDRPGKADIARKREVDFDRVATEQADALVKFHAEWLEFLAGKKFPAFEGPRDKAIRIGLLEVRKGDPLSGEEDRAIPWRDSVQPGDDRAGWHDIYKRVTLEELRADYADTFSPIKGFACLDEKGWHEPGTMGWFACSSDTPETYREHSKMFAAWLRDTDPDAWLVAVDCHI